jgi:hypothetical protein
MGMDESVVRRDVREIRKDRNKGIGIRGQEDAAT